MAYQRVTLAELVVLLRQRTDRSQYWTDEEARLMLNEALRWWNLFTGYWTRRLELRTVANRVWYDVPSTLAPTLHAKWRTTVLQLGSAAEFDLAHPNWEAERIDTGGDVPDVVTAFLPTGLTLVALWPADTADGTPLLIDGVRDTPVLVLPTDYIDIGDEELSPLLDEAQHLLTFKEGGARFAASQALHTTFLRACAAQNDRLLASAFFRSQIGVDRSRQEVLMQNATRPSTAAGLLPPEA